jgi:hypothetical protein
MLLVAALAQPDQTDGQQRGRLAEMITPLNVVKDVDVDVVDGALTCDPQVKQRDKVKWNKKFVSRSRYKLTFFTNTDPAAPAWPFEEAAVDGNSTGYVDNFTGTIAVETGVFKYSVEVEDGSAPKLDPMIIVRR